MPSFWEQFKTTITSPIKRIGEWFGVGAGGAGERPTTFEAGKGLTPVEQIAAQDKIGMMAQEKTLSTLGGISTLGELFKKAKAAVTVIPEPKLPEAKPITPIQKAITEMTPEEKWKATGQFIKELATVIPQSMAKFGVSLYQAPEVFVTGKAPEAVKVPRLLKPILGEEISSYAKDAEQRILAGENPVRVFLSTGAMATWDATIASSLLKAGASAISKGIKAPDTAHYAAWEALGKPETMGAAQKEYRGLAQILHPDKPTGSARAMSDLNNAYRILEKQGIPKALPKPLQVIRDIARMLETPVSKLMDYPATQQYLGIRGLLPEQAGKMPTEPFRPVRPMPAGLAIREVPEKPITPAIPKELEPLAQEARKYKSAEEFSRAVGAEQVKIPIRKGIYFRGEGEFTGRGATKFGSGTYITEDAREASMFGNIKIAEVDPNVKLISVDDPRIEGLIIKGASGEKIKKRAIELGFDGIKIDTNAVIFDKNKVKLTDFYNQAVKGLREKGFLTTIKRAEKTTDELKQALGEVDPFYKSVTNKNAIKIADVIIKSDPDKARTIVLDPKVPVGARKSAIAIRLAKKYEAEKNWDAALEIIENYDEQLRGAGRFIQAASLWNKLSPESIVRLAERAGEKYKKVVPQDIKKIILRRMAEIQKMPEGPARDKETLEVLNYVADQFPLTFREKLDAFRYQNMLSNPRSHERNIFGNLLQTFVTRPLDLIGEWSWDIIRHPFNPAARDIKLAEIPKYYQAVFKTIPDAFLAFKEGFRGGAISEKIFDVAASRGMTMVEFLRRQNLPKGLTMITRFMEAQDRFFSTLIGAGEKARLMAKGIVEKVAEDEAKNLAEKYLYREKVGITTKDQALFVRALDGLGKLALQGRNIPVIGKVWNWFVPFVRTPINIAKFGVERSPLGFIGGTHTDEQMGKALIGSIITGIGAVLALQDRTTFLPSTDPKAKRLFYDSGRKPLSVKVGDNWIPMWYFGPYAIALALPAAVKYYTSETKEALTENDIEKIGKIILGTSRIITEQTPLSGMSDFMKAVEGDIDYSIPGTMARTAGQAIPFVGLISYINTILDPVYRKSKTFSENLKKQLPGMTKDLPAYEKISGEPATRNWTDFFLPYSVGMSQDEFEKLYKERIREIQIKYKEEEMKREMGIKGTIKVVPLSEWGKPKRKKAGITPLSQFGR